MGYLRMPALCLSVLCLSLAHAADDPRPYDVAYHAHFRPDAGYAEATLTVRQSRPRLIELDFHAPECRYSHFDGDGDIERHGERLIWRVPREGGELRYRAAVDHDRSGADDARLTERWALARLDDLFPPARARSRVGAYAEAHLTLSGPDGWSFETRYGPVGEDGVEVETRGRRFDRPLGWMVAGELGIRRTRIAGRRIAIAGPMNEGLRRMDMLVFLRWTLPELVRVAPTLPERVLVVSGSRDMWRGGLSGPGSLYLHPDRPLVSGNATSSLLHELMHVAMEEPPARGADWIVEGLAEYYSLVVLMRTGGIDDRRFQRALDDLEAWARRDGGTRADPSTGADTAHAVTVFRDLDLELRDAGASLDAVVRELLAQRITVSRLRSLVAERLPRPSKVL